MSKAEEIIKPLMKEVIEPIKEAVVVINHNTTTLADCLSKQSEILAKMNENVLVHCAKTEEQYKNVSSQIKNYLKWALIIIGALAGLKIAFP